ncbi:MAG: transposase family protein [Ignavibacteriaceae bacterium]|nr:transposase family protein [Ignavibacteriaceae bacterium]
MISFLEKYGVSSHTINNGTCRNRKRKTIFYEHFYDSINKKKIWLKYSSLPIQLINSHKLPPIQDLMEVVEKEEKNKTIDLIKSKLSFAFENGYRKFIKYYLGVFHEKEIIESYARTHSLFSNCLELKQFGIKIKEIFPEYIKFVGLQFQTKNIKSFYQKLLEYELSGHRAFIHKNYGTVREKYKLTENHLSKIAELYRDSKMLSGREIHEKLNLWAVKNGYSKVSLSAIKNVMANNEFQNRNRVYRNGCEWKKRIFDPFLLREKPEYNGTLWQIDGSRLQIPYLNKNKPGFLNYFVIYDVHSGKIVGYSIDKSENSNMIVEAIKMAVENCKYAPMEIVSDSTGGLKSTRFTILKEHLSLLGTQFRKHEHPRDKGQVERFVGSFQTTVCKNIDGYIGEGIKSRRVDARPSNKVIQEALKPSNLRSESELKELFPNLIDQYNKLKINDKKSPNLIFDLAQKDEYAPDVSDNDFTLMFWNRIHDYKIKNSMVLITEGSFRKQTYQYIIDDYDLRIKLNLSKVLVCYSKSDRSYIKLFDENENHIIDVKRTIPVPIVFRKKVKKESKKSQIIDSVVEQKVLSDKNQLYKQPETLDILFIKSKNNE